MLRGVAMGELKNLEKKWTAGTDGKDFSLNNGKIELSEIHAIFRQMGIKSNDVDKNADNKLDNREISQALNHAAQKNSFTKGFLGF